MGKTSGYICLIIGIISLIASIFHPGSLIVAAAALSAAYINLKGRSLFVPATKELYNPDGPIIKCPNCGTENTSIARVCRGCNETLTDFITEKPITN